MSAVWTSPFGETREQWQARRAAYREIILLLKSDLYEQTPGTDNEAVWQAPLGWTVRFQVEAETWRCVIIDPSGDEYARLDNPNATTLDAVLP